MKDLIQSIANLIGLDFYVTEILCIAAVALLIIFAIGIPVSVSRGKKKRAAKAARAARMKAKANASAVNETVVAANTSEAPVEVAPVAAQPAVEAEQPVEAAPIAAKPISKPAAKSTAKTAKPKTLGKWIIERKSKGEYLAALAASNGEIMLTSETYSTEDGAIKGIATIIKAVSGGDFVVYKNKNGSYYFKLKSATNRLLCAGEIYNDKAGCENAIESVKRIAADSPVMDGISDGEKYVEYTPLKISESDLNSGAKGRWKIENTDDGKFFATLYASNGQVMLSTEEVSSRSTAVANIENVKKNALAGNFVIDKDKFGKFYYKLRNANKSVICIGESYPTASRCISALESVRKLAAKSPIL